MEAKQITFSEEEVRDLQNFLRFISEKARFNLDWAESVQLTKYSKFMQEHVRKVNAHVLELRKVVQV